MISNFTIWSLQYFPNFSKQIHCHCFPKILFLKVKSSEVQHSINLCMLIHDWNSFEIYIKEICALCQWQASGYDSPKKKKKKTICLKEILKQIAQHCSDCIELYIFALCTGQEFFISYIIYNLLQWFCEISPYH